MQLPIMLGTKLPSVSWGDRLVAAHYYAGCAACLAIEGSPKAVYNGQPLANPFLLYTTRQQQRSPWHQVWFSFAAGKKKKQRLARERERERERERRERERERDQKRFRDI